MSNFSGATFPFQRVTPSDDAIVRRSVLQDSILSGCKFSYSGSTLTMAAGHLIACGRQFRHTVSENWAVTGATSGYARLLLTIDTTKASTKTAFEQVNASLEYAAAIDGFPGLTQSDINEAGIIYQVVLCVVSLGTGGITGIVSQLQSRAGMPALVSFVPVTLPVSGWVDNTQTVTVPGVLADRDKCGIVPGPEDNSHGMYYDCDVRCAVHLDGQLTFSCEDVPGADLEVNVLVLIKGGAL